MNERGISIKKLNELKLRECHYTIQLGGITCIRK